MFNFFHVIFLLPGLCLFFIFNWRIIALQCYVGFCHTTTCVCVCVCVCVLLSHVQLFATPQIVAHQAPLSMGFSRQEHWSGLPFPSPKGATERKKVKSLSRVQLFATPWSVAYQATASMEFYRQEYWSGLSFPSPIQYEL